MQIPFQVGLLPAANGLIPYSIIFVVEAGLLYGLWRKYSNIAGEFALILGVFGVALLFRTVDLPMCANIGIGTHFMWHVLVALAFFLTVRFLVKVDSYEEKLKI